MTSQPPSGLVRGQRFRVHIDGGEVGGWRYGSAGMQRLLFCHANGFCASAYRQALMGVGRRYEVYAIDLRGHGRTSLCADPTQLRAWSAYASDITAILDHPSLKGGAPWILAGHSCGAVSALLAAVGRRDVERLLLIEPVATPVWMSVLAMTPVWPGISARWPLVRNARRRRATWPSRAAAKESYARKGLFSAWAPSVLDDYLEDGLVERNGEAYLACRPDWEAASFAAQAHDFWKGVRWSAERLSVLAADDRASTLSRSAGERLVRLGAHVRRLRGAGHLLPMEAPSAATAFLLGETVV